MYAPSWKLQYVKTGRAYLETGSKQKQEACTSERPRGSIHVVKLEGDSFDELLMNLVFVHTADRVQVPLLTIHEGDALGDADDLVYMWEQRTTVKSCLV